MNFVMETEIESQKLWDAVAGSGVYYEWFRSLEGLEFGQPPCEVKVTAWDPHSKGGDSENLTKTITVDAMFRAFVALVKAGYSHCGVPFGPDVLEDPDACVADLILQVAVYGEVTYG